ncbi:MAG: sigma-70 family RNA polymerase sigma factor [Clostridia bacterium]|nr:sigma-70 family RNA polymerase sigma factor [Clostridia bacterium]MDE7328883.1 sigma-70 family RNA polymerase sigma factor [Clostridia bacterium]
MQSEIDLIKAFRGGDKRAVEYLMESYKGVVNKIARVMYVKGGDRDDVVQEGMIALYNAIVTYDIASKVSFSTYATECIKNRILDCMRSGNRLKNKALSESLPITSLDDINITGLSPEEIAISAEEVDALRSVIDEKLTKDEIKILDLYYEGMSYAEIAQTLDKNTKYVDNALQRIRRKIRLNVRM